MLLWIDKMQRDVWLVAEPETPGPGANQKHPVISNHQPGQGAGAEADLVNPPELGPNVRRHLSPVPVPGVEPQLSDHRMVWPVVEWPVPEQRETQGGEEDGDGQQVVDDRVRVPESGEARVVAVEHHSAVADGGEVGEGEEGLEHQGAGRPLHVVHHRPDLWQQMVMLCTVYTVQPHLLAPDPVIVAQEGLGAQPCAVKLPKLEDETWNTE